MAPAQRKQRGSLQNLHDVTRFDQPVFVKEDVELAELILIYSDDIEVLSESIF